MINKKIPELFVPENSKKYHGGPICISGPPGVGKSTIGKKVAERISVPFFDLDNLVAEKYGVETSREVIQEKGTKFFRKLSHNCLKEVLKKKKGTYILGFGGATIIHLKKGDLKDKNKELVEKYAFTICLLPLKDIIKSVKILWSRQDDGKRLTGIKTQKEYQSYLKERMTGYIESADLVVYTHHASIKKIVSKISFSFNKLGIPVKKGLS